MKHKVNRNLRIGCENGQQMNGVWQVLKDAGEPMYSDAPNYSGEYNVMVFSSDSWMGGRGESNIPFKNIPFKEFMAIMKPEKENVQYVTNLIDYLDKPELIQNINNVRVIALHYFPDNAEYERVLAVFEGGETCRFSVEGFRTKCYKDDGRHLFILRPKPKEYVTGWRRPVICENGSQFLDSMFALTKEEFMKQFENLKNYRFGPWEKIVTEVCDD